MKKCFGVNWDKFMDASDFSIYLSKEESDRFFLIEFDTESSIAFSRSELILLKDAINAALGAEQ